MSLLNFHGQDFGLTIFFHMACSYVLCVGFVMCRLNLLLQSWSSKYLKTRINTCDLNGRYEDDNADIREQ